MATTAVSYPSRISFTVSQEPLRSLIDSYENEELIIPEHQREDVWKLQQKQRLVKTVLLGTPMPPALLGLEGRGVNISKTLQDGRQRLTSLSQYRKDLFEVDAKKFSQLTDIEKFQFNNYPMPVLQFKNATLEQIIDIFDNFQNGTPLSAGERYHSLETLSPIVKLAKKLLLTPGDGFHDRAEAVWGTHNGIGKRGNDLVMAMALIGGLAFSEGTNCLISKKYAEMADIIKKPVSAAVEARVRSNMDTILSIYEEVQRRVPFEKKSELNFQWNLGNFTGYIAYSLNRFPDETARLRAGWIEYLCEVRNRRHAAVYRNLRGTGKLKQALTEKLHRDITGARSWNAYRWYCGYLRVFDPAEAERYIDSHETATDSSEETDE